MPSEFNHIDEFFRLKEDESTAITKQQEKHWQQMRDFLAVPKTVKIRTINIRLYWQAAAGIIILAVFAFLLIRNTSEPKGTVTINNKTIETEKFTDTVIKGRLNEKSYYSVEKKSNNSGSFSITIKTNREKDSYTDRLGNNTIIPQVDLTNKQNNGVNDIVSKSLSSELSFTESKQKLDVLFEQFKKPAQEFFVNSNHDTTIHCNEGTTIFIPANSFQTALGLTVSSYVKLYVQEFYNFADIIGNKLNTTSNGEILVTAGMLYMNAKTENEVVQIKPGVGLGLQIPTKRFDPQMQLFTGKMLSPVSYDDETSDTMAVRTYDINWMPIGQKQLRYAHKKKMVTVLNLSNNPQVVLYKHQFNPSKMKSVAKFTIPWYCTYSTTEIKEKLERKFSRYYDEIRVKRASKPWTARARLNDKNSEPQHFYDTHFVGDTVTMHLSTATRLKYITKEDSLAYEAKWKRELEDAIKRNQPYNELLQLNDKYDFKINALGWINCDRFLNYPKEMITDLKFSNSEEFNDTYFHSILVFNKTNVLLQGNYANNKIIFQRIPKGQSVSLVCIGVKNGKLITCIRNLIVGDTEITDLQFQETKPEELKEKLKQFGSVDQRG